jgi:hypothetical protein
MPNLDISDLHGVYPTALRWSSENGVLGYSKFNEDTGERTIELIELGSPEAKFAMDYATRARGYGLIRKGFYDLRLTPVGSPPPEWPGDDDFKPAIGCFLWNPQLGELRLETNAAIFRGAISAIWDQWRRFREASENLQPVIHFVDRVERPIAAISKVFSGPIIKIVGSVERNRIPNFAAREATVKSPLPVDSQIRHSLLEHLQPKAPEPPPPKAPERTRGKSKPTSVAETLTAAKLRSFEQLLAAAASTPDHAGWSTAELYNRAKLYGAEVEALAKAGRLVRRGDRYYVPKRPTLNDLLDDGLPDDSIPEL